MARAGSHTSLPFEVEFADVISEVFSLNSCCYLEAVLQIQDARAVSLPEPCLFELVAQSNSHTSLCLSSKVITM